MLKSLVFFTSLICASSLFAQSPSPAPAPQPPAVPAVPVVPVVPAPPAPGASLDGYRFEFPCTGKMPAEPKEGENCASALVKGDPMTTDKFETIKDFGGEPGKKYEVTLRFRGVVEPMMYKNGAKDGEFFYIGGEPDNGTYNIYEINISSPASHYYLNRQDKVGHRIFAIDYTKTIQIDGGAKITLRGNGQNGKLISNFSKLVAPGVPPAPAPFHGQFVQVNVVKVTEKK